jgi:hypothetical protein
VPAADGNLAGDQQRSLSFAVIDDLQQVPPLLGTLSRLERCPK